MTLARRLWRLVWRMPCRKDLRPDPTVERALKVSAEAREMVQERHKAYAEALRKSLGGKG
jgi:hypothetical protein